MSTTMTAPLDLRPLTTSERGRVAALLQAIGAADLHDVHETVGEDPPPLLAVAAHLINDWQTSLPMHLVDRLSDSQKGWVTFGIRQYCPGFEAEWTRVAW